MAVNGVTGPADQVGFPKLNSGKQTSAIDGIVKVCEAPGRLLKTGATVGVWAEVIKGGPLNFAGTSVGKVAAGALSVSNVIAGPEAVAKTVKTTQALAEAFSKPSAKSATTAFKEASSATGSWGDFLGGGLKTLGVHLWTKSQETALKIIAKAGKFFSAIASLGLATAKLVGLRKEAQEQADAGEEGVVQKRRFLTLDQMQQENKASRRSAVAAIVDAVAGIFYNGVGAAMTIFSSVALAVGSIVPLTLGSIAVVTGIVKDIFSAKADNAAARNERIENSEVFRLAAEHPSLLLEGRSA